MDAVAAPVLVASLVSPAVKACLRSHLAAEGLHLALCSPADLENLPPGLGPIVVEAGAGRPLLAGLRLRRADLGPWLSVVEGPERGFASGVLPQPAIDGFVLPEAIATLMAALRWAWVDRVELNLVGRVREVKGPLASVTRAVGVVVRQRPHGPGLTGGDVGEGTVVWMAREARCSRDHLSKAAGVAGVDILRLNDRWKVLLATVLRSEGLTWEKVSWRLDYRGEPGLNALFRRVAGMNPTRFESSGRCTLGWCQQELSRAIPVKVRGGWRERRRRPVRSGGNR